MLMEGPREPSELVVIRHQKRYCGRLTLNLTKVCPWSLPSTTDSETEDSVDFKWLNLRDLF